MDNVDNNQPDETDENKPKLPPTRRDAQRGALRDLVELAGDCASTEAQIEQQTSLATTEAEKQHKRALSDLDINLRSVQQQIAEKHHQRQTEAEATYKNESAALKEKDESAQRLARHEYDKIQAALKKNLEEATWQADSLLEGEETRAREELRKVKERNANDIALLDAKRTECYALLDKYGHTTSEEITKAGDPPKEVADASADVTAEARLAQHIQDIDKHLSSLRNQGAASLFVGVRPHLIFIVLVLLSLGIPAVILGSIDIKWMGISGGSTVAILIVGMVLLRSAARKSVSAAFAPLHFSLTYAYRTAQDVVDQAQMAADLAIVKARKQQKAEAQFARDKAGPMLEKARRQRDEALTANAAECKKKAASLLQQRDKTLADLDAWLAKSRGDVQQKYDRELAKINERHAATLAEIKAEHDTARAALEKKWADGLHSIQTPIGEHGLVYPGWDDPMWANWDPPKAFPPTVRFGELEVNVKDITAQAAGDGPFTLQLPQRFAVPALMAFPRQASLLIHADRSGRTAALSALQMMMSRLLTTIPPGRVRFTLLDPVGLGQNFAGFMHLADYDEQLVGVRIWTDTEQIDQRLANLTEHMETVIQKYLRNEFETIDDYNAQAGELAEPYRFLVIADLPVNFSDEAFRRLSSIATTGARCGVYTMIFRDTRVNMPAGTHLDDLEAHSINLVWENGKFTWRDEVFSRFPLLLDAPPAEDDLTKILRIAGQRAKESNRVEVSFAAIAPELKSFWTRSSAGDLAVPVGRSGATRLQSFRLGKGVAQHALVAGKTGSGKSTLLHALISNLAMWYSPDEIEMYLIDFKKGVEFKTYATYMLPHARAIAVESDREFGLSVLQRIDAELSRRGTLFRKAGVQDLASYRKESGEPMPRTLLIIDEFQEFFSEDDKLGQDAALLLDRLVRQGRAFGVHVLLGSQTIGGSSGLSRSTIGQMAVRIALQTSEADSQLILGDGNSAARLLSRPGEAIYNDAGGLVEGNSPFQVAWLSDEQRERYLQLVRAKADGEKHVYDLPAIVFEGNAPADIAKNTKLMSLIDAPKWETAISPSAWLGEPVAIKDPTAVIFRRQSGANMLIIGQAEEQALAIMSASLIALAAQHSPGTATCYILDGSAADSPSFGVLAKVAAVIGHTVKNVEYRAVGEAMTEINNELVARNTADTGHPPAIFVLVFGLQRYRALRKQEDSFGGFSSSSDDEPKPVDPGKVFADLLRDGPAMGMHVIGWIDTVAAIDRTLDRNSTREFDNRILFQMSAADSSGLIDSPAANKLGVFRALAYSEEQGTLEKFRPYAVPGKDFLAEVSKKLASKTAG